MVFPIVVMKRVAVFLFLQSPTQPMLIGQVLPFASVHTYRHTCAHTHTWKPKLDPIMLASSLTFLFFFFLSFFYFECELAALNDASVWVNPSADIFKLSRVFYQSFLFPSCSRKSIIHSLVVSSRCSFCKFNRNPFFPLLPLLTSPLTFSSAALTDWLRLQARSHLQITTVRRNGT